MKKYIRVNELSQLIGVEITDENCPKNYFEYKGEEDIIDMFSFCEQNGSDQYRIYLQENKLVIKDIFVFEEGKLF